MDVVKLPGNDLGIELPVGELCTFIALPNYDGTMHAKTAKALWTRGMDRCPQVIHGDNTGSLLGMGMNVLWGMALKLAADKVCTHFCMLHADVLPEDGWMDMLLNEMDANQCQVLSGVIAIKDSSRDTSTAIDKAGTEWDYHRLNLRQIEQLPQTFDIDDVQRAFPEYDGPRRLLVNTGLMMVDLRNGWANRTQANAIGEEELLTYFTIRDRVTRNPDGTHCVSVIPEDWGFSRMAHAQGCKVMATSKIRIAHCGQAIFTNYLDKPKEQAEEITEHSEPEMATA